MIVLCDDPTSDSMLFCDIYMFDDDKIMAFGSIGVYSKESQKYLETAFENNDFIFIGSYDDNDTTCCYYISEHNIGGIVYSDTFICYVIISDEYTQTMLDAVST